MGNMCSQNQSSFKVQYHHKRKMLSKKLERNSFGANPEEQKIDTSEIISLLLQKKRTSMRNDCPQIHHIQLLSHLGKGAQAQVYRVSAEKQAKSKRNSLGQKVQIAIRRLIKNKNVFHESTILASQILLQSECSFIIKGFFICQTDQYIYQGIKLAEGRDLTSFLEATKGKGDSFRALGEQGIRLILAGVVLALQYLHERGFVYCDLKTDNILVGSDGYPFLADFDLIRKGQSIPSSQFQGNLIGMGPEIFISHKFDKGIDLWALGVLIYTLIYNEPPFEVQDFVQDSFPKLCLAKQQKHKLNRKKASIQILDLINKLMKVNPKERLGYNSIDEIKIHRFFSGLDWSLYEEKKLQNPISLIVEKFDRKEKLSKSTQF